MLHHTDNTLNKDNPDNWDEADIEDLVQQELAKIAQLPAEELLDNYAPNTAPAINDETESINALTVTTGTGVLVGSVVVRKDAWSDILRFHNDRQKDDNVIRRLGSELISGEELEQMEGAIDGSANDPAEAAIWEIDTSLPELLLASSKEIAEIGDIEREQEESREFLRRLKSSDGRQSVLDPLLMHLREQIYQEEAEQLKIAHTVRIQKGAQAQLRYKLDRLKNSITARKADIRSTRDSYLDSCQQIKSIEKDFNSAVNVWLPAERSRSQTLWRMADAELHKLQQTILPSHQRLLISVLEELDQQKTNRQTVVEEHREVYVRLESEQVNLLALTRTVEAEEKRRERLMNAHRLMVHELEVLRMEAAIKLQSRWRGRLRFLRYHRIRSATISIQHAWRRFICRKNARIRAEQERLRKAATRIQAVFRSFRIRKKYLAVCAQFANRQPVVDFPITRNSKLLVADLTDDYEQLEEIDIDDFLAGKESVEFDLKWDDYLKESDAVPLNTIQNNLNRRPYNSESNIHALNSQQQTIQQNRRPSIQETAKIESLKNEWGLNSWEAAQRMYENKKRHSMMQNKHARRQALKDPLERLKQFRKAESKMPSNVFSLYNAASGSWGNNSYEEGNVRGGCSRSSSIERPGSFLPALPHDRATPLNDCKNSSAAAQRSSGRRETLPPISPATFKITW